jgi:predicted enzyme related to lactoylglutathione lyase
MSTRPKPSVVLFVDDVARLTRFYQSLGSMTVEHEADDHAVLEIDGVQLVIHGIPVAYRQERDADAPIEVREDSYFKFCFAVDSIAAARVTAAALGGQIGPVEKEWDARGFRACDGHDPEGNVLQVRESAA